MDRHVLGQILDGEGLSAIESPQNCKSFVFWLTLSARKNVKITFLQTTLKFTIKKLKILTINVAVLLVCLVAK